jgi:hypothetical protein
MITLYIIIGIIFTINTYINDPQRTNIAGFILFTILWLPLFVGHLIELKFNKTLN